MRTLVTIVLFCGLAACSNDEVGPVDAGGSDEGACVADPPIAMTFPNPDCPINQPPADALDEALAKVGLTRCTLGYSAADLSIFSKTLTHDAFRLPWYDAVHDHAVRAPAFARDLAARLDKAAASPTRIGSALAIAAESFQPAAQGCLPPLPIDAAQPLAQAVAKVVTDAGGKPDLAALEADAADVPLDLQRALAEVVLAAGDANAHFDSAIASLSAEDRTSLTAAYGLHLTTLSTGPDVTNADVRNLLSTRFDLKQISAGAITLATRLDDANLVRFANRTGFTFDQDTPIGRIIVRDAGNDTWPDDGRAVLVQLDTGGDDHYLGPTGAVDAATDATGLHHVSIAIDLAGKDDYGYTPTADVSDAGRLPSDAMGRYHTTLPLTQDYGPVSLSETPRQGAARLGYGFLLDLGREADHYRSLRMSQGYGTAGVGVLYDAGGDDVYEGEAAVQGGADFGIGLLIDDGGNDHYRAYVHTQGFAFVRGVGVLYDKSGDDNYYANTGDPAFGGDPIYLSVQIPGIANDNFAQGAGFGYNGSSDGVYMSGGLGMLRDGTGNDVYQSAVYSQSSGYWFGTGILVDGAGNDAYDGRYYVQGSTAHFALAVFIDEAGDDKYNQVFTPKATSIGIGHDFSTSWHIDGGGNDIYRGPLLSMGGGNANGLGVMLNIGGDDIYQSASEPTLGVGNLSYEVDMDEARRGVPTTGVFIDIGGHDQYGVTVATNVVRGDNVSWVNDRENPDAGVTTEHGVGVDRADGTIALP